MGAVAARTDARRSVRRPAADRRCDQADDQGRHHAGAGRQVGVHRRADHLDGAGADRLRGHSVRSDGQSLRTQGFALHHRHQRRPAVYRVGGVRRRVRHHPGGLFVEQQVPAAREPARVGAADLVRSRRHADARQRHPDGRLAQHGRNRQRAVQPARLVRLRATVRVRPRADRRARGNQPRAVRSARGGAGADRRISH